MDLNKRNISMDALRAFAIIGVVVLHLVGGINTLELTPGNRLVVNVYLAITYIAVNLFGIASGYLKIDRPHHYASLIKIVLQTLFWCFLITLVCAFLGERSIGILIKNAFPFTGDRLWYITCYCFVFFCAPYLNVLAEKITQSAYRKLIIILTVLMSVIPTICFKDFFHVVSNGYSAAWLIYMYLVGGYIKKFGFWNKASKLKVALVWCFSICTIVISKYVLEVVLPMVGVGVENSWILYYYNSPLTLLNSICILYLFINGNWKDNITGKLLTWLSTVSLGVYIIHAHPFSLDHILIGENLMWVVKDNPFLTILMIFVSVIGICLVVGFFEWLRILIFKMCGIDKLTKTIGCKIDKVFLIEQRNIS